MRRTYWLPGAMVLASSCYSEPGCAVDSFDSCQNDFECGFNAVCDEGFLGRECVPALECESAADCPTGDECTLRPAAEAPHPFEGETPGKQICLCESGFCGNTGGQGLSGGEGQGAGAAQGGGGGAFGGMGGAAGDGGFGGALGGAGGAVGGSGGVGGGSGGGGS